ncbi:MAG: hypothetical protein KDC83_15045, partial [Flavobacteriales bacterium]|nr:hypothetical protein [Flavobacteriales bacterium]
MNNGQKTTTDNSFMIQRIVRAVFANWYFILLLPALGFAIGFLYSHRLEDVYAAQSRLILKSTDVYDYQKTLYAGLGLNNSYGNYDQVESQKRVIKSSNLLQNVLDRLNLNVAYYIEGRIKTTEVYRNTPFQIKPLGGGNPTGHKINIRIIDTHKAVLAYKMGEAEIQREILFGEAYIENGFAFEVIKLINISEINLPTIREINYQFSFNSSEHLVEKIKKGLSIESLEYTSVLEMTLSDNLPARAVDILDTLAVVYRDYTLENKFMVNRNTQSFIDRQIGDIQTLINGIESNLETYKDSVKILDLDREETQSFARLNQLETQYAELKMRLMSITELETYILKNNYTDESFLPPSIYLLVDPFLQQSLDKIYELQIEKKELLQSVKMESHTVQLKDSAIVNLRSDVITYLRTLRQATDSKLKFLESELATERGAIRNIPKSQRELLNIERKLKVNEELLNFLLQRKAETIIAEASIVSETRVIENPKSIGIIAPNKTRIKLIAFAIGMILAGLIAFLRSFMLYKIVSVVELGQYIKLPVIGGIRRNKNETNYHKVIEAPKSQMAESFRTIRTNFQFFIPDKRDGAAKVILVSSLYPGEGKTFCSVNIAGILAAAGKKTLIIDFDLHKPRVNRAFKLEKNKGVSTILIGKTALQDSIVKGSL